MKIERVEVREYRRTLAPPLRTSRGRVDVRRGWHLRLRAEGGIAGFGEAAPVSWLGEDESAGEVLHALARRAPWSAEELHAALEALAAPAARCALETALLDLAARDRGVPLAGLLGAPAPTLAPGLSALLTADTPEALAAEAAAARAAALKLKVGGRPLAEDLARVAAVRRAAPGIPLRLDANRAWSFDEARAALAALAPLDLDFVEEPLRDPTPEALQALREAGAPPLALDESAGEAVLLAARAFDVLVVKLGRAGGPRAALALAQDALRAGRRAVVTDAIETGIGMWAALHVAAALPGEPAPVGLGGRRCIPDEALRTGLDPAPRELRGPGLGPGAAAAWDAGAAPADVGANEA